MASQTSPKLPFLDFSNPELKQGTPDWESLKSQVREALEEYGCFEATFSRMSSEIRSSIFGSLEELFDLPLETKERNASNRMFHGYIGPNPHVPLYESMGIATPTVLENVENITSILWPQGNMNFSKTIQSYSEQLSELEQMVRKMIVESFGLEKYMDEHLSSTNYLLRVMKYKGVQTTDAKLGLTRHTDKNTMTILYQNQVEGLEVQTKDGSWIKFQPTTPSSFVVLAGDSLLAWLNGRVHSPFHRVMMSGDEERYSLAFFTVPKAGKMIQAPEEMVDEQHPLLFKPFDYDDLISFFYSEAGKTAPFPLKAYCGI